MMSARYRPVITLESLRDIHEIGEFIAKTSPDRAAIVTEQLLSAIDPLAFLPNRHKVHQHRKVATLTVRMMPSLPYLIYYRVDDAKLIVGIIRVLHGAQRQLKRFR